MDQNQNEPSQDGLENLPQKEQEETRSILDEIEKSAPKSPEGEKPAESKPEDSKPSETEKPKGEDGKKPDESDGKPVDDKKPPEGRRQFKMVPSYLLEKQQKDHEKEVADLKSALEESIKAKPSNGNKDADVSDDLKAEAKAIAEKHGIDADTAEAIISAAAKHGGRVPAEITEALADLKKAREEQGVQAEMAKFAADFDRDVLPALKAEYGDDVPASVIESVKEQLKEAAYSKPEYQKTPFKVIYKGDDAFRNLVAPKKKGAEGGRGGHTATVEGKHKDGPDLTKPLLDDELKALSPEDFDTYSSNMEKRQKA